MKRPRLPRRDLPSWLPGLVALVLAAKSALAQPAAVVERAKPSSQRETVIFTTNLLSPFFGAYTLDASVRASNHWAVFVNSSYFSLENGDWKTHSGSIGAGVQYYFQGEAMRRWYAEGFTELLLSRWRHEPSGSTASSVVPGVSLGSVLGYRWLWEPGLVLDLAGGAVLMHFPSAHADTDAGAIASEAFWRLYPAVKLNLGWAF
jgi:hypothetical protein